LDVFAIAESKIDESFPTSQFQILGYKTPFRLDNSGTSGGLLVYVKSGIPTRYLTDFILPNDIQIVPIELRLKKDRWLAIFIYRPPSQNLEYFLDNLSRLLDFYSDYKNCILMGDFNKDPESAIMTFFLEGNLLFNHMKSKTCFKSSEGTCIDLILSNQKYKLQNTKAFDTGLSDFHLFITTELKSTYTRVPSRKVSYRNFNKFCENSFLEDLSVSMSSSNTVDYHKFESTFIEVLDRHAPQKSKMVRGNEKPHINRALRKAIMRRSRLRTVYLKSRNDSDWQAYREQRNFVTNLNKKTRRKYFESVALQPPKGAYQFWKLFKPFLSDKFSDSNKILLVQDSKVICNDFEVAQSFNSYFNDITKDLKLKQWSQNLPPCIDVVDPILYSMAKYREHPSIIKIKSLFEHLPIFSFSEINTESVHKIIMSLEIKKSTSGKISPRMLKLSSEICSFPLASCFNSSLVSASFPASLKCASITPILKKGDATCMKNYRPISILPTVSKVFEKVMASQLNTFFESRFSSLLCGFRKGHSTQHALLRLLYRWQKSLDQTNIVGTVLMDLSKAYDCLPHDLLIAKLAAYGVDHHSLTFIHSYLKSRKHNVKIYDTFSEYLDIVLGVPQGSILGPLLFNIFLNDLLLCELESDLCNFADDNTLYAAGKTVQGVKSLLEIDITNVLKWFEINSMAANPAKFQIMFLGTNDPVPNFLINNISIPVNDSVKLLGITIDHKLKFKSHTEDLCKKASSKTKALLRIRPFLSLKTTKALCNAYIISAFNYCPLIWMNFIKGNNTYLAKTHRRALSMVFQDFNATYSELLAFEQGVSLHISFIHKLLLEVFKSLNGLNPSFLGELFIPKSSCYSLRSGHQLVLPPTKTITFGTKSLCFMSSSLWNRLPKAIKESTSLSMFKTLLLQLPNICHCGICNPN